MQSVSLFSPAFSEKVVGMFFTFPGLLGLVCFEVPSVGDYVILHYIEEGVSCDCNSS